jgi:hypothetical protein
MAAARGISQTPGGENQTAAAPASILIAQTARGLAWKLAPRHLSHPIWTQRHTEPTRWAAAILASHQIGNQDVVTLVDPCARSRQVSHLLQALDPLRRDESSGLGAPEQRDSSLLQVALAFVEITAKQNFHHGAAQVTAARITVRTVAECRDGPAHRRRPLQRRWPR